jgi:hypothetical protein
LSFGFSAACNEKKSTKIEIGANGNWFIDGVDTGVKAQGTNGVDGANGKNGTDGSKVEIGANGNWFIDGVDTGVKAGCDCGSNTPTDPETPETPEDPETPTEPSEPTEYTPVVRFAVASDVHLRQDNSMQSRDQLEKVYATAYDYADEQTSYNKLDGIFMVGDAVNYGTDAEYTQYFDFVEENTRSTTVSRTVMGNHEYSVTTRPNGWNTTSINDAIEIFKTKSGYESEDAHLEIGGFHFIFLSMDRYGSSKGTSYEYLSDAKLAWLKQQLDASLQDDSTGKKPIFVFQHVHARNTVEGSASATMKLYVNGVEAGASAVTAVYKPPSLTAQFFALGGDSWTEDRLEHKSNSNIAACGVYSYALTAAQVAERYAAR